MHRRICRDKPTVLLIVVVLGVFAGALTPGTAASARDTQAMATLQRMADFLSQAQRFSVTAEIGFDVVQESGEKLEFGETRQFLIRRPDRVRVDITRRDGDTLDEAIAYFINDLDMRFPLAELFSTRLAEALKAKVRSAYNVGPERIMGVPCEHIALRGDEADMQLWVAQGDRPLPCRLVITYRAAEGQPQFWAQFSDWNLSPDVSDARFVFTPPEGAVKIAFTARKPVPTVEGKQKGKEGARP
jgi:hypothetical protein